MSNFSHTSRTVAIVTAVVGGFVIAGIGASAAVAAIGATSSNGEHSIQPLNTTGITGIDIESNSSQFTIEFADVPEATLKVEGESRYVWDMRIDDTELVVTSKSGLFDFCIGWCAPGNERVTLTLPSELSNGKLTADLTVDTGSMQAAGDYSELSIEVNAGSMNFEGAAKSLDTSINAGRANLVVEGAKEADLEVDAGFLTADLGAVAPRSTTLAISAGSIDLLLPNTVYNVTSKVEAGRFVNDLRVSPTSQNVIDATVEAGKLTLRYQ